MHREAVLHMHSDKVKKEKKRNQKDNNRKDNIEIYWKVYVCTVLY